LEDVGLDSFFILKLFGIWIGDEAVCRCDTGRYSEREWNRSFMETDKNVKAKNQQALESLKVEIKVVNKIGKSDLEPTLSFLSPPPTQI